MFKRRIRQDLSVEIVFFPRRGSWRKGGWWTGMETHHKNERRWRWWKLLLFSWVKLEPIAPPSTGYGLWIYNRRRGKTVGRAIDIYFDRRDRKALGLE